jgi:Mor family transcriptional regulator
MSTATPTTPELPPHAGPDSELITPPPGYPELLSDLLTMLAGDLRDSGLPLHQANAIAWACTERLRDTWGGQSIYITQGLTFDTLQRYQAIWDKFNGQNVQELAREYDMSEQAIYKAIRIMRAETAKKNQLSLAL